MKLFSKSLKPEEVINFLKENPDFFIDHPEAIEHLEIKHESGEAVSFIEKQVEFIKSKNLATSTQLKDFILNANANDSQLLYQRCSSHPLTRSTASARALSRSAVGGWVDR